MDITTHERDDGISHVVLSGRLDTTAAEELGQDIADATAGQDRPAVVDVSGIEFLASMGIGLLLANSKRLTKAGHKLVILNPQGMVDVVLKASRLDKVMAIAYDLDAALHILRPDGGQAGAEVVPAESASNDAGPEDMASLVEAPTGNTLKLSIKNEVSEFKDLNASLAQFLAAHEVPSRAAYTVDLAVEELVMNVIRYAFVDDDTHPIDIELAIEGEQVVLRIADGGRPFDPRENPELDLDADDRQVGGLGLYLVVDMVDMLKYQRVDEQNRVEVRISMTAGEQVGDLAASVGEMSDVGDE